MTVRDGIVVMGTAGVGGFMETPLGESRAKLSRRRELDFRGRYMEQILAHHVNDTGTRFLVIERKENRGRTETSAALSFAGERQGIASWLAAPGPMGTLDYVSPEASFAGTFVVKNPATLLVSDDYGAARREFFKRRDSGGRGESGRRSDGRGGWSAVAGAKLEGRDRSEQPGEAGSGDR